MKLSLLVFSLLVAGAAQAAVVVDSFTEKSFTLFKQNSSVLQDLDTPFGILRRASVTSRAVPEGGSISSTLDTGTGQLSFAARGQSVGAPTMSMALGYINGGPYSLAGESAFEFDFSELRGTGSVVVELGGESIYNSQTLRLTIDHPGVVTVPFTLLNFNTGATVETFNHLTFTFEARSEDFSFTLDEIRAVPEASTLMASALGAGALALRRRRR